MLPRAAVFHALLHPCDVMAQPPCIPHSCASVHPFPLAPLSCPIALTHRSATAPIVLHQVASWLARRAVQIDAVTGQLPDALQLLELAVNKGFGQFSVSVAALAAAASGSNGSSGEQQQQLAAAAAAGQGQETLSSLLTQLRVLMQLLANWWPVQGDNQRQQQPAADAPADSAGSIAASAAAALQSLQPLWSVTLSQWVSVGLLPQLLAVFEGSSRDLLQQDLNNRWGSARSRFDDMMYMVGGMCWLCLCSLQHRCLVLCSTWMHQDNSCT